MQFAEEAGITKLSKLNLEVEAEKKPMDMSVSYEKGCTLASCAWEEARKLNLESSEMIGIPTHFVTFGIPRKRLNAERGKIKFLYSDACRQLQDEFNKQLKKNSGFVQMNFKGTSGAGKTFALLYLMMKLRLQKKGEAEEAKKEEIKNGEREEYKKRDSNDNKPADYEYRVVHIDFAKDITQPGVLNDAILTAFYNDRKVINLPPGGRANANYEEPLCYWYMASSKQLLSEEYSLELYNYCNNKGVKLIYLIDQENSLTSTKEGRKIADLIRQLPCHGMIVSASNNNEGFQTTLARDKFTTIEITNGFSEEQAINYINNSPYASTVNNKHHYEEIKKITGYRPLELSVLLHPDEATAKEVSKLEPKPGGMTVEELLSKLKLKPGVVTDEEITELAAKFVGAIPEEISKVATKLCEKNAKKESELVGKLNKAIAEEKSKIVDIQLSVLIDAYTKNRGDEIIEIHRRFRNNMKDSLDFKCLVYSYSVIDRGIEFDSKFALLDKALMYVENGLLYSVCPLAHQYFDTFLYATAENIDKAQNIYSETLGVTEDSAMKGLLLEEILKCYFSTCIKKSAGKGSSTLSLLANKSSINTDKTTILMGINTIDYDILVNTKEQIYYEKMFAKYRKGGVMFFPRYRNFPGIDCLILAKDEKENYFLCGIQITINIVGHDKSNKSSFQKFMVPSKTQPQIVPAFKKYFKAKAGKVYFVWMGGRKCDNDAIWKKIDDESKKYVCAPALCSFIEDDPQYNSLDLQNAFEQLTQELILQSLTFLETFSDIFQQFLCVLSQKYSLHSIKEYLISRQKKEAYASTESIEINIRDYYKKYKKERLQKQMQSIHAVLESLHY
eukprot:TRINITY_DN2186_c0_g1_i4.p1 TRINITY_DN2186_c0_g1~~TRINITY_DN2186_c0_g1_i4.p1  ORF type:complete len:844 (-),score=89.09 TRINITY_DN2186_c0_g1_i4:332-2863(-)